MSLFQFLPVPFFSQSNAVTLRPELENIFHHRHASFNNRIFDGCIFIYFFFLLQGCYLQMILSTVHRAVAGMYPTLMSFTST